MAVRKLGRDPEALDSLRFYSSLPARHDAAANLGDPARLDDFPDRLRESLASSLASQDRLQGIRVEAMFHAVVTAIGAVRLLVEEDAGAVYFQEQEASIQPADYRLVDHDGEQMLVEVKAVPPNNSIEKPYAMREVDVQARSRYAALTGAPLYLAYYWPMWNLWTLVSEDALERVGNERSISVLHALRLNEMHRLGDVTIATRPPLSLVVEFKQTTARDAGGHATATITDVEMEAERQILSDPLESNIAWTLLRFGSWAIDEQQQFDPARNTWRIKYVAEPPSEQAHKDATEQGPLGIGALSSLFSAMFNDATLTAEGAVRQLDHQPRTGLTGSIVPDDYWGRSHRLRIWRLRVLPNVDAVRTRGQALGADRVEPPSDAEAEL